MFGDVDILEGVLVRSYSAVATSSVVEIYSLAKEKIIQFFIQRPKT